MELDILLNPYNGQPLHWAKQKGRTGLADAQGYFFPVRNGYPNFLAGQQLTGLNERIQRFYDRVSRVAGLFERMFDRWFHLDQMRGEWLRGLTIHPGDRVLEVSVGTGSNIRRLPAHARYYGLDISSGMLDCCVRNARHWEMPVELCQGNAEYLPYRDNSFDSVFHVGGINFFNDRGRAIREMIRVAKPGARIVIIDETAKEVKAQFRKIHFLHGYLRDANLDRSRWYAPAQFVPEEIRDVEVKLIDNGAMYRLSFVKPVEEPRAIFKVG